MRIILGLGEIVFLFGVWLMSPPEQGHMPHSDPLALSGKRSGTKLNGAVKGAALLRVLRSLQHGSLSTDASQWSSWGICPCSGYFVGSM